MSGHSKWATMHRKKEKNDAARGKIFTMMGRQIVVAVKEGGPNPEGNNRLAEAIAKAKANNMPNDNIKRLIERASGAGDSTNYDEVTYEGYAPGGVAIIVETMTDNKNRTGPDVRLAFDRNGGSLGATGCVSWMFDRKGVLIVEAADNVDEDELMMAAIDAGAEDFAAQDDVYEITTAPSDMIAVRDALKGQGYVIASDEIEMVPQNTVAVDQDTAETIQKILDRLEDNDDVQNVYHNAELPEEEEEE